ncbi:MBG domain-containing protein [uncultured Limosilactobacillus sp.]|uniref:mucin-binding protein n=1 Tax=uncultured Limosilactobacillus sp. TaxID=2837629 RepID=UPI0025F9174E|nr:MBG domain-containing protein [uncultured Limosilactobacillus sp.]
MMRYKLYKHKKQWVVGATVVAASLALMTPAVHAATTDDNAAVDTPTAVTRTPAAQPASHDSQQASAVASNQPATEAEANHQHPRHQLRATVELKAANENIPGQQAYAAVADTNNPQTETPYGTTINPNNYTVHIGISGLAYTIPPYHLVDGDLRFATDQEVAHFPGNWRQPALVNGQAVNVGTYAVVLSRAGFDHLLAWVNGMEENGKWVPQPGVENITFGEYNLNFLIVMWESNRPSYTVTPYLVKVTVTGSAPLGTSGLDSSQYHVQLASNGDGQSPVGPYQTSFDQFFQPAAGDFQVSATPLANGSYRVTLTNQGWQHVLVALEKTFNSYGHVDHQPNFSCQPADVSSSATASLPEDDVKTVTRTIKVELPDQQPRVVAQTATVSRKAIVKDGRLAWEDWTTATWPQFTAPTVAGYIASQATVPEVVVTNSTSDQTIIINYAKDASVTKRPVTGDNGYSVSTRSTASSSQRLQNEPGRAVTNQQGKQLPQTGDAKNGIAALGLDLMGLTTMLGLANKKKHERD